MRIRIRNLLLIVFVCSISASAQVRGTKRTGLPVKIPAAAIENAGVNKLPIRRVILYSNGVAYIERRGFVSGNAEVDLSFKQSQVDDVLKSMIVLDLGQGKIGAVSYNSSAPVSSRMSEIPFSVNATSGDGGGISSVLGQLQGAKVIVTSSKGTATGSILTVERKQIKTDKETQMTNVLVIASEGGEISSFDLNDVRSVKLLEDGTRKDLNEFANATASARRRDAKTITVTSQGLGQREMVVSYTISAPIWKTTYRVVLDTEGKPFFQGWAIVDNVSDEDWQNVQLSLVSGSPISFIQQLQQPFYRYRPVVPMPQDLQLRPQVYEPQSRNANRSNNASVDVPIGEGGGAEINTSDQQQSTVINQRQIKDMPTNGAGGGIDTLALIQQGVAVNGNRGRSNNMLVDGTENQSIYKNETTVSDALRSANSGVTAAATGEEIGDLFEYKIEQPVTVMRDRSALIPIVQTKMDGERVAVYNEAVRPDRPFSGVSLKNTTNLTLESGSITVIDGNAYAGETLMERLKPKEQRLISFALDLGTHVTVRQSGDREPVKLIKAVNGVFQVHYFRDDQKTYQISNQTDRPKVLYIEYPIHEGWELSENSPKPDYTTQRYYRFRIELKGLEEKEIKISTRQPLMDSYHLTSLSKTDLELFVSRKYITDETRVKLQRLIDLRANIESIDTKVEALDSEVKKIEADQKRIRENIEALSKTPEAKTLIERYIAKAGEQETRLEQIGKERRTMSDEKDKLERDLALEIKNFEVK